MSLTISLALSVHRVVVAVGKTTLEVSLGRLLHGQKGSLLQTEARPRVLHELLHQALEGELGDENCCRLLVPLALPQRNRSGTRAATRLADSAIKDGRQPGRPAGLPALVVRHIPLPLLHRSTPRRADQTPRRAVKPTGPGLVADARGRSAAEICRVKDGAGPSNPLEAFLQAN